MIEWLRNKFSSAISTLFVLTIIICTKDGYELIVRDGKTFAIVKDGNPDNYFCPNCYTQINPNFKTCVKCDFKF